MSPSTALPFTRGLFANQAKTFRILSKRSGIGQMMPFKPSMKKPNDCAVLWASISSWTLNPNCLKAATTRSFACCARSASVPATLRLSAYGIMIGSPWDRSGQGLPSTRTRSSPSPDEIRLICWCTRCATHIAQLHPIGTTFNLGKVRPSGVGEGIAPGSIFKSWRMLCSTDGRQKRDLRSGGSSREKK